MGDASSSKSSAGEVDLEKFKANVDLTKYCRRSKPHLRPFHLNAESRQICWASPRKSAHASSVFVDEIQEIRLGVKTKLFQKNIPKPTEKDENNAFSVVYGGSYRTLDIMCSSKEQRDSWVAAINALKAQTGDAITVFLRQAWRKADKNGDNQLSLDEINRLLGALNVNLPKGVIKKRFQEVAKGEGSKKYLDFERFTQFYKDLKYRKEIEELFDQIAKQEKGFATVGEFRSFLKDTQHENRSEAEVKELISKYGTDKHSTKEKLSLEGFLNYLTGADGSIFNPAHLKVYQDMDQPLPHYWINSSHNTYLLQDQLKGPSSPEAYVRALSLGCRCVELDCWDGPDGEPIVYHGHTLTSKILFKDVIKAVRDYSFKTSPYPVILSLEVHTTVPQQKRMAEIMVELLGDMLWTTPLPDGAEALPSPSSLKNKILVKGKSLPSTPAAKEPESPPPEEDSESEDEEVPAEVKEMKKSQGKDSTPKVKISKELSDLVVYCKTAHFKNFEHSRQNGKPYQMSSFAEAKSLKLSTNSCDDFIVYNRKQLSRIYPSGKRVDSSNYDGRTQWNAGCQIVAFNYQTLDRPMQMNLGKFTQNGACGYVLKPEYMRVDGGARSAAKKLAITVISGQQLPKPDQSDKGEVIDPYVEVDISGADADTTKFKTKVIQDNGFDPSWNETFEAEITEPDVCLIRFVVMDQDVNADDFIASATVPFNSIQQGYRHITLRDVKNTELPMSTIFVKITFS